MSRIVVYFSGLKQNDRWFKGDGKIISFVKKLLFIKPRVSSLELVFNNLVKGLTRIGAHYAVNLSFNQLKADDTVLMLGRGMETLQAYTGSKPVIAGIGLMTHPAEVPDLFSKYPVKLYLQHSEWTQNIYNRFYGDDSTAIWPAGIDTDHWKPENEKPRNKILIYSKIMWPSKGEGASILDHVSTALEGRSLDYEVITYGSYTSENYRELLGHAYAMIFLCEHESQGMACQEALSMNVPVFAWDQGYWLDPSRFGWGETHPVPATSVPYFDETCGMTFKNEAQFSERLDLFISSARNSLFESRKYVLSHLSLERSAERMLDIVNQKGATVR